MNAAMRTFGKAVKPLFNIGIGQLPGMTGLYRFVWSHFGPKGVQLADVDGFKLYVICRDWAVAPSMLFAHSWEPAETEIFRKYIKEGMTVVDAGAYIGYYSVLASKLVGEKGKVYSFEPSPENQYVLYRNLTLNECRNVTVSERAVSDRTGLVAFYPNLTNPSGSTLFDGYSTARKATDPEVKVFTVTLDEVIGNGKVDFVKMDIEGGEIRALNGMEKVIKNNPNLKMIVELFPIGLGRVGSSLEEFVGFLQQYFRLHILEKGKTDDVAGLGDIREAVKKTAVINLFCERK